MEQVDNLSAVARVEGLAWNTVARWLEKAADVCRGFNQRRIAGFVVEELQADEIRSFVGGKTRPTWMFVAIEVWSRLGESLAEAVENQTHGRTSGETKTRGACAGARYDFTHPARTNGFDDFRSD